MFSNEMLCMNKVVYFLLRPVKEKVIVHTYLYKHILSSNLYNLIFPFSIALDGSTVFSP